MHTNIAPHRRRTAGGPFFRYVDKHFRNALLNCKTVSKWAKDGLNKNRAGFKQAYVVYKQGKVDQLDRREEQRCTKEEVSGTLGERSLSGRES